jgi:cytochrome c5
MRSKLALGLGALVLVAAVAVAVPAIAANQQGSAPKAGTTPGDVANGKIVYVKFCGKCHSKPRAHARTLGNNLDHCRSPSVAP